MSAFPSPIYDNLESNIPSVTMQYFNSPFPEDCPLLPNADAVLKCQREHAADIIDLVAFRKQVLDVRPAGSDSKDDRRWAVKVLELETNEQKTEEFDAVIVANGRYNGPYYPDVPGLQEWREAYPDSVSHSKFYRSSEPFREGSFMSL
jgi:cation diffusion facilitator CzcD-associated flavoprotein CzcO